MDFYSVVLQKFHENGQILTPKIPVGTKTQKRQKTPKNVVLRGRR